MQILSSTFLTIMLLLQLVKSSNNNNFLKKATCFKDTIPNSNYIFDTTYTAIIPVYTIDSNKFPKARHINLSNRELQKVERLLNIAIKENNRRNDSSARYSKYISPHRKYLKQYVPYLDTLGNRKVFISGMCTIDSDPEIWRKQLILIVDGGKCFFRATINLTKNKCESFKPGAYG